MNEEETRAWYLGGLWVLQKLIEHCGEYQRKSISSDYWQKKFVEASLELRALASENGINLEAEE